MMFSSLLRCTAAVLIFGGGIAISKADVITQDENHDVPGESWSDTPTSWSNNEAPSPLHDYLSNTPGWTLRSPTSTSTFGGKSLTVSGMQFNLSLSTAGGTITVNNFHITGGAAMVSGQNVKQTLAGTLQFTGTSFVRLNANDTPARDIDLASTLSGNGTVKILQKGTLTLLGTGNTFSGHWIVGGSDTVLGVAYANTASRISVLDAFEPQSLGLGSSVTVDAYGTFRVRYDWETTGSLTLNLNSLTILDNDLTLGALTIGGESLGVGTYNYDFLSTTYSGYFNTTGEGGSITVVPEPTSFGALVLGSGVLLITSRKRRRQNR
jgi:hypothetical protein